VASGSRDNYKIWEEGAVPSVVFEMTSPSTRKEDDGEKKTLYAQLGVAEYWQFDPQGDWITEKLRGYRLEDGSYQPIADQISLVLGLRLDVDDSLTYSPTALIAFYDVATGKKLLLPAEWQARAIDAEQNALDLAAKLAAYEDRFGPMN
jgi:hypothetical protein